MKIKHVRFLVINLLLIILLLIKKKKKIGVIGLRHEVNIGNNLLKYAIFIKLSEFGFDPCIIGTHYKNLDITFLKKNTHYRIIFKNFSEIKKSDYDFLMVNSDQTWRKFDKHFYDYGFLKFARNWNIPKFIYGASLGYNKWRLSKKDENIIKDLLKNFTEISVREKGSIELIEKHLGIRPKFVLDPTLLINKKYYLNLINNYKLKKNFPKNFLFTYVFEREKNTRKYIKIASKKLNYKVFNVKLKEKNSVEKFIYGISNCKAVITNSFHGTVFSIIFNKPFVSFIFKGSPKERLISLKQTFKIEDRIFNYNQMPRVDLLTKPLNLNYTLLNILKFQSINFLKRNLGIK